MTNTDIYTMTRQHLWTDKINQNKLRFTGRILRLPEGTPARRALQPVTRPIGRQKTTWTQSTNTLLQSVCPDNLGTNKPHESVNDKKTLRQKTDDYVLYCYAFIIMTHCLHMPKMLTLTFYYYLLSLTYVGRKNLPLVKTLPHVPAAHCSSK